jgi:hypothetical protein
MAIPYIDTNPKGNGLLHVQGTPLGDHDLPDGLPGALVHADRPRDLPARSQLELFWPYEFWDINSSCH